MRATMQTVMTVVMRTTLGRRQNTMKTMMARMAWKKQKMMLTMVIINNIIITIIIIIIIIIIVIMTGQLRYFAPPAA